MWRSSLPELKVVMLTPHGDPLGHIGEPEVGGQCVYIRELSTHLALLGLKVLVFTRDRGDGKPPVEPIAPGAELVRLPCGPRTFIPKESLLPYLGEFADRVRAFLKGDETLHSHFWDGGQVAQGLDWKGPWLHTSHSLGKRKLAAMPDADPAQYRDRIRIETQVCRKCDLITAATELERKDLEELYGVDPSKVVVIPPGVDTVRFRPPEDIFGSGWWTVLARPFDLHQYTIQNYIGVIYRQGLGRSLLNSLLISVPATFLSAFVAAFAAFGFAWMRFPGRRALFMLVVALMVVPLQMTFIPILPIYRRLHLSGTFPGIWLAHTAYGLPLTTYLLHSFISNLPKDIFDSASIDGASPLRIFLYIVVRCLSRPWPRCSSSSSSGSGTISWWR